MKLRKRPIISVYYIISVHVEIYYQQFLMSYLISKCVIHQRQKIDNKRDIINTISLYTVLQPDEDAVARIIMYIILI